MKKILFLIFSTTFFVTAFSAESVSIKPSLNANNVFLPVGKTGEKISLMELSTISLKDFESLVNRKMKFFDRLAFKAGQKKLKKGINEDGTFKKKRLEKFSSKFYSGETGFHAGGFFLGFLLGAIGLVIAYVINDDYKKNRIKWAWIGFGFYIAIVVALVIVSDGGIY